MKRMVVMIVAGLVLAACANESSMNKPASSPAYLDSSGRDDALSGGVKLIPISTPKGNFKVWTKRVGNNPRIKLLLLHGGPGATHEYFEACDSYLPAAEIEYYYYDQLGSAYSDQPNDPDLWEYMELLIPHHYAQHILRMPPDQWPDPVNRAFKHINPAIYVPMQGPSELGASGKLLNWDRRADLGKITVPTLVIGAQHDTMDPKHMEWMSGAFGKGHYLYCPSGSHMAMYDDQKVYFEGFVQFIRDVSAGRF